MTIEIAAAAIPPGGKSPAPMLTATNNKPATLEKSRSGGYRSIAVHLKNHEERSEHIDVAIRLADRFGAVLTGLLTQREPSIFKKLYSSESLPLERLDGLRRQAEAAEARFRAQAQDSGIAAEFTLGEGDAAELLGYVGRFFDLVVVEQTDLSSDEIGFDVPENCLATSGRPVLVVPNRGSFPMPGRSVLVAWNGSREAALAIHHARPFLAGAERVTLLEGRGKERFPSVTKWPEADIRRYLGSYVDRLECRTLADNSSDVGEAILWHAGAVGADLVVMGAYGRSWLAEWVLRGATRHVLRHSSLPLLMAH